MLRSVLRSFTAKDESFSEGRIKVSGAAVSQPSTPPRAVFSVKPLHTDVILSLKVDFYFATPHHAWERGSNENTNGLLRQYLPKGTDLAGLTQWQCNRLAAILNNRPPQAPRLQDPKQVLLLTPRCRSSKLKVFLVLAVHSLRNVSNLELGSMESDGAVETSDQ